MDIVTPILNIVSLLCSCSANNRCCYLLDLQENKENLNNALVELRATRDGVKIKVDEAENNPNQKRTPEVDNWLQRVQTIDDEVVQVIQKADQEIQGRCFGGNYPINCWSARKIGKLVLRKLPIVNDLKSKGDLFVDVAYRLPSPLVQREPVDLTVGMESMFDKVWSSLAEEEVRIMGLYGQGGVGKTTLLKQINNEFLKSTTTTSSLHGFNVVILVVVSKVINIHAIQKEIGDRLGLPSPDRRSIFNALTKKNFVLLLDDLWQRVDLQSIGIPTPPENKKSKVVFTTRSKTVCGLMDSNIKFRVECLPWDEAWTLFQDKVGNETLNSFPIAREVAKVVAKECGGLPLALITIGRAMSTKNSPQEWDHAITTLQKYASEFPGMGEEVLPLLKLSYDNLRDDMIKSCFLYCALFPEDEFIDKTKLIDYWIGEGLISLNEFDHIDEARNKGYYVIGILKGASLLESGVDEEIEVKMHDTIRDLALWIAHDCERKRDKMLIIKTSDLTAERSWYNAERIYLILPPRDGETEVPPLKSPNLITLIHHFRYRIAYRDLFVLPQNFLKFTPHLRVLDLSGTNMETFPISITELLELRYLSLSRTNIKVLPEELGKLVKLNYLDLSYMMRLKEIPIGVMTGSLLLELRVLNLHFCRAVWDIKELYKLQHLNDLRIHIDTHPIMEKLLRNKNLQMCTRGLTLCIESKDPQSILEKLLQLLFNLETLALQLDFSESMNMGIEQQQHLGRSCFQNLIEIQFRSCNGLKDLTWVGYVPKLKTLYVYDCKELEVVIVVVDDLGGSTGGDEIISSSSKKMMNNKVQDEVFKRLKTLVLVKLPKLKSICSHALAFPCLVYMQVYRCPELKKLPFDSSSSVNNTFKHIFGGSKWWSELQWEEEEDHNNNNNNELLKFKFLPYFVEWNGSDI